MIDRWDSYFLHLASIAASMSKDPSTKVGCIIVRHRKVIGTGFNGFPIGMSDDPNRYTNREEKYTRIIHAEENALLNRDSNRRGFTCYTWPFPPCTHCSLLLIQAGVTQIVAPTGHPSEIRWTDQFAKARSYYEECGITLVTYPLSEVEASFGPVG